MLFLAIIYYFILKSYLKDKVYFELIKKHLNEDYEFDQADKEVWNQLFQHYLI